MGLYISDRSPRHTVPSYQTIISILLHLSLCNAKQNPLVNASMLYSAVDDYYWYAWTGYIKY